MKKGIALVLGIIGLLLVGGSIIRDVGNMSVSMIGSKDGPTSVFFAGKLGDNSIGYLPIIGGILLIITGVLLIFKKDKK